MKLTFALAVALGMMATVNAATLVPLGNASLDSAIVGGTWTQQTTNWQSFPGRASAGGVTTTSLAAQDGAAYGSLFSTGATPDAGDSMYQNVTLTNGQLYEMSIFVASSSLDGAGDPSSDTTAGVFAIAVWANGYSSVLAESAWQTITGPDDTWTQFTYQFTADADAQFNVGVRNYTDDANGNATVYVDNVSLTAVPEPSSAALLGLGGLALILRRRK